MQAVFISVLQVLAALTTGRIAVYAMRDAVEYGLSRALIRVPANVQRALSDVLGIVFNIFKGLITVPIAILKLVIIAVIELPVKVLWATVPGLKAVMDAPSISKIFS